jgi:nicotinamide riboside transporter PnuC
MNPYVTAIINISAFAIGQFLVTRRHWVGFLIWAASNLMVAAVCIARGEWATACMFIVYCVANVWSMIAWSPRKHGPELRINLGSKCSGQQSCLRLAPGFTKGNKQST